MLTPSLKLEDHIKHILPKIVFLRNKLHPVLVTGNARYNVNAFKVFILPLYRLAMPFYDMASDQDK